MPCNASWIFPRVKYLSLFFHPRQPVQRLGLRYGWEIRAIALLFVNVFRVYCCGIPCVLSRQWKCPRLCVARGVQQLLAAIVAVLIGKYSVTKLCTCRSAAERPGCVSVSVCVCVCAHGVCFQIPSPIQRRCSDHSAKGQAMNVMRGSLQTHRNDQTMPAADLLKGHFVRGVLQSLP